MKKTLFSISIILSILHADQFSDLSENAINDLQDSADLDSKTTSFTKDMVNKLLKTELSTNKKSGFFLGVEGSLNKTTLNYTFTARNGTIKRVDDPNAAVELGLTAGYDFMFNDNYGLSTSLYLGKPSDIKSDVSTGYFGHVSNATIQSAYTAWKSGFDANFLYQLTDSIRLSAGLNYRYTKYNNIPSQTHKSLQIDAFTRAAPLVAAISDDITKDIRFTPYCRRGNADEKYRLSVRCEGNDSGTNSTNWQDSDKAVNFGQSQKHRIKNFIQNYIQANADHINDPNFAEEIYRTAHNYKRLIEWQWNLEQSIRADLADKPTTANSQAQQPNADSLGSESTPVHLLYANAFENAKPQYEDSSNIYATLMALDLYKDLNDYAKTKGYNLARTSANYLPGNLLRQACGNYNKPSQEDALYDAANDCFIILDKDNQRTAAINQANIIRKDYYEQWISLVSPRLRELALAQLSVHTRPLTVIADKLSYLEKLKTLQDAYRHQETNDQKAADELIHRAALAANTPAYKIPSSIDHTLSYYNLLDTCALRGSTNEEQRYRQPSESATTKYPNTRTTCSRIPVEYSIADRQLPQNDNHATFDIARYIYGYTDELILDYSAKPLTLEQSRDYDKIDPTWNELRPQLTCDWGEQTTRMSQDKLHNSMTWHLNTCTPPTQTLKSNVSNKLDQISKIIKASAPYERPQNYRSSSTLQPQIGASYLISNNELYLNYKFGGLISYTNHSATTLQGSMIQKTSLKFTQDDYITLGYKYHF